MKKWLLLFLLLPIISFAAAYDISTFTYGGLNADASGQVTEVRGLFFKSDGTKLYVAKNGVVYQYSLSTAWNASTATYDSVSFSTSGQTSDTRGLAFSSDGTKMYVGNRVGSLNGAYQYTLSPAWDLSSASYASKSCGMGGQISDLRGITVNSSDSKIYGLSSGNTIYQYSMTSGDLSTCSYDTKSFSIATQDSNGHGLALGNSNASLLVGGRTNGKVFQYTLGTPSDISTASYSSNSLTVSSQESDVFSVAWKASDGGAAYAGGGGGTGRVYEYDQTAPPAASFTPIVIWWR